MVYEETDLSYMLHDEGMLRIGHSGEARSYTYFYHLKDHLGNNRVEFQANPANSYQVTQRQSYYPFGLRFEVAPAGENEYLYNGKEFQEDLIAGRSLGWYDYGARMYDPGLGRFHKQDRFAEKYFDFTPYQYGANNPALFIDVNGDSIYISHRNERILYHNGNLYWAGTGEKYDGKAYNRKGNLKGFVKHTKNALDDIATGGNSGSELVNYFQGFAKDIQIEKSWGGNSERGGIIKWNPKSRLSDIPNNDGTSGRSPFVGLAHEMGHTWDRIENGKSNFTKTWYTASNGDVVRKTEKVATWWENRIRSENQIGLRTHYSFTNNGSVNQGDSSGRILIPGTSNSEHINIFGKPRLPGVGIGGVFNIPYKY